jgi:hypothetical protein
MDTKRYETLDELALEYQNTTIIFRSGSSYKKGTVLGVIWSLPLETGERDEPALVIYDRDGLTGHVYPHEVKTKRPA